MLPEVDRALSLNLQCEVVWTKTKPMESVGVSQVSFADVSYKEHVRMLQASAN